MSYVVIVTILCLSAFTHLWNPIGFPSFYVDEGHYMRRALQILDGLGFQESKDNFKQPYDHPYFGQIFLASIFKIIGYPDSLNPKPGNIHSVEMLYLVPRVLMGLLAVVDTFLVYKIADRLYGRKVAFIASIFFAVMPMTWMLRRIYLDSILLPFLLSSIFFALYYPKKPTRIVDSRNTNFDIRNNVNNYYKQIPSVILSGIFLGLAIFTKIPVFMMIPLVAYLIYKNSNGIDKKGRLKTLSLWFIPVILIPAIWPAYSMLYGHFDDWLAGVLLQTSRTPRPMENIIAYSLQMDAVLLILGTAGIVFAAIRRDAFILLWSIPFFVFLTAINYVGLFHLIPLVPVLCIAASTITVEMSKKIPGYVSRKKKIQPTTEGKIDDYIIKGGQRQESGFAYSSIALFAVVAGIGGYGLAFTTSFISVNTTSSYFDLYTQIIEYLPDANNNKISKTALIGPEWLQDYYWMPRYVFNKDVDFLFIDRPRSDYTNFVLIADTSLMDILESPDKSLSTARSSLWLQQLSRLSKPIGIYNDQLVKSLPPPDINLKENYEREIVGDYGGRIEIRANY